MNFKIIFMVLVCVVVLSISAVAATDVDCIVADQNGVVANVIMLMRVLFLLM